MFKDHKTYTADKHAAMSSGELDYFLQVSRHIFVGLLSIKYPYLFLEYFQYKLLVTRTYSSTQNVLVFVARVLRPGPCPNPVANLCSFYFYNVPLERNMCSITYSRGVYIPVGFSNITSTVSQRYITYSLWHLIYS